jgi:hypothetical protein
VGEITEAFHPFLEEDEQRQYVCDEREIPPARAWGRSMKADNGLENLLQAEINHQFVLLPPGQPSEIKKDGTNEWLAFEENTLVDTDDLDPKEGFPVRLDQLIELG